MKFPLRPVFIALLSVGIVVTAVAVQPSAPTIPEEPVTPLPGVANAAPRYWKGNLHTHSLWSDGDDFPEMIADWYKRHGYQFLALTEHNTLADGEKWVDAEKNAVRKTAVEKYRTRFGANWIEQREVNKTVEVRLKPQAEYRSLLEDAGKFLLVPAEEITHKYAKAPVHINAINLRDAIKPIDGPNVGETIRVNLGMVADQRKRTGWRTIAFLNHPNFGWGVRAEEMLFADDLRFFEVFNGHPGVRNNGDADHASCERLWDIVNAIRVAKLDLPPVRGLATDDAHGYHAWGVGKVNPGRGWVMVRAPHLSSEAIVAGLEAGDFYASTGVLLDDVRRDGDELKLTIRGEPGVTYRTEFIATMKDVKLDSTPRLGANGEELPVTRVYAEEIGKIVAKSTDLKPSYQLTGNELYVRAKVVSSKPHPNPYQLGDTELAWTQPIRP